MSGSLQNSGTLHSRIVRGSVVLLSGSGITILTNLAYNIVVARFLGPNGFGQATAVFTLLTLVSALTLSFQIVSAKVVAQQAARGASGSIYKGVHRTSWIAGLVVGLALLVFQLPLTQYLNLSSPLLLVLLSIAAAFYVPLGSRRGQVQGEQQMRRLAINLVLEGLIRLFGSWLMVVLGYGVEGVIAANAVAVAVAYFAIRPRGSIAGPASLRFGHVFRESQQALVFFSGQMLINNCDIVLVKHFFASTEAGVYAAVAMVGRVIFALCQAVVNSMVPVVAGSGEEDRKSFKLIATALLLVLGIGAFLALALRLSPPFVWERILGSHFNLNGAYSFPKLLAFYAITTVVYSLSAVIITYEMSYKIANTSFIQLAFSGFIILGIYLFHSSLQQVILVQLIAVSILLLLVGGPLLRKHLRKDTLVIPGVHNPVRVLRRSSESEVIAGFLRTEFDSPFYDSYRETFRNVVCCPDFNDEKESALRRSLLFLRHRALWKELPADTEWYEVEVGEENLSQVRVFPRAQWRKIARGDFTLPVVLGKLRSREDVQGSAFLSKIAAIRENFHTSASSVGSVVMIGLDLSQPLAIIDGNHRFVAAALENQMHRLRFFCGLSPYMTRCCWYRTNFLTLTRYGRNLMRHLTRNRREERAHLLGQRSDAVDRLNDTAINA